MPDRKREKPLVPKLRFPEFKDAGEWEVKRLGEVCDVLDSLRKPVTSTKRRAGSYPYYGASGAIDYIDEYIFDERLLLIGEDGAKWGPYEKTAFIVEGKYWVNNHAHVLRPTLIIDTLLENYLTASDISIYVTGAAPPKLTLDNLISIQVPVPRDRGEQQKIVDCLSALDELIELEAQKCEALKAHKKGLMQQLFPRENETIPRLRFPGFRNVGEWEVKRLGKVGEIITGTTPSTKRAEYYANGVYPWVTPTDIGEEKDITETKTRLSKEGLAAGKFVPRNSLLVTCIASIGKNAILRADGSCNQQINAITSLKSTSVDFLYYLIEGKVHVLLNAAGQGGMAILNKNEFSNLRFPFPALEEQQKIADCLSSLDALIELKAQKVEALKQHKKGLMQQLFPQEVI